MKRSVLNARQYIDCSDQFKKGRAAWLGLNMAMATGDAAALSFDEAVKLAESSTAKVEPLLTMRKA
jgi:hypothetical protein